MINKLNARGWSWLLAVSLAMVAAAILTLCVKGLNWPTGIFAAIAAICAIGSYLSYRKEIS